MLKFARLAVPVLAVVAVLLFATGTRADSFTITISGTPITSGAYAGDSVSGTLDVIAAPDGLGDGGFVATSITSGSLTFTDGSTSTDAVTGLVPLDPSSPSPFAAGYDAYYICDTASCYHYWGYDNLLYPGTPDLSDALLFTVNGKDEPVELFCSSTGTCGLGVWLDYANNGNDPYDSGFEYYSVTLTEVPTAPEPSSLLLLGLGLLALLGLGRTSLREKCGHFAARA